MVFDYSNEEITGQSTKDNRPISATGPMLEPSTTAWAEETKAVIIHCRPTTNTSGYTSANISSLEAQFHTDDRHLDIPALVGLPLWTRHHSRTGPENTQPEPPATDANEPARSLCVNARAQSANFLSAPSLTGDRLFARRDGKDLPVPHLLCLKLFCDAVVLEFSRSERRAAAAAAAGGGGVSRGNGSGSVGRREAEAALREMGVRFRRLATRERFRAYWVRFCREGFERSRWEGWRRMRGPYDW